MKFVCIEWGERSFGDGLPESERKALMDRYLKYLAELRIEGSRAAGGPEEPGARIALLSCRSGEILVQDGTEEPAARKISGILFLEGRDLNHVIQKLAGHPGLGQDGFRIGIATLKTGWGHPGSGGNKGAPPEDAAQEES